MALPKPPVKNMTDFVVFCFVSIVFITLLTSVVALFIDVLVNPDHDRSALINVISDTMTTLIGALIGFVAGKGTGRAEVHEEHAEQLRDEATNK